MNKKILISLLLFGLVIAGSLKWESDLIYSHKFHAEDVGAECTECHEAALTSESGTDDLLPAMETCYNCHDEDMECTACHANGEEPVILPRVDKYSVKFSHKIHQDNEIGCLQCHAGIEEKTEVNSGMHLPDMDLCMTCHKTPAETEGCYLCHTKEEELVPVNHSESWDNMHGMVSESGAQNCNSCHVESYCLNCHQGENLNNESHSEAFIATHGISWQVREIECETCHTTDYCIECHVEVNFVVPMNHGMAEWSGREHAQEARANFENCTVCHTQNDNTCIQCHTN